MMWPIFCFAMSVVDAMSVFDWVLTRKCDNGCFYLSYLTRSDYVGFTLFFYLARKRDIVDMLFLLFDPRA